MPDDLKVVVLGCGPAGLIAAHAAIYAGADVRILSKPRKSFMKGAQYLHKPIPFTLGINEPFTVQYLLDGEPESYRSKVYGPAWDGTVSPEDLEETHQAWDIRTTYDWLWDTYGNYVVDWDASQAAISHVVNEWRPDLVVSSIPAPLLCAEGHTFGATNIWSTDEAMHSDEDNTVRLNGHDAPSWYRSARIQGWGTTEWPERKRPPISSEHLWLVPKPLKNNCTCWPEIVRVGRYGSWTKGVLSHEAWDEVTTGCLQLAVTP